MTTNVEIITDALRLLGVVAETQTASAEQGDVGLRRLNQMIEAWTEDGIELGWFAQSSTVDTAPLPSWAEKGVTSKLAQDLQAIYPSTGLAPWVFDDSLNGFGTILRKAMIEGMRTQSMASMPLGEGHVARSRILTDL